MKMPAVLPEAFLRCLDPAEREKLGQAGLSAEEAARRTVIRNERHLQGMIVNLLRLRGIEPLWHRTDKKSAATVGWPDITFSVGTYENSLVGIISTPCAWEIKLLGEKLSVEQEAMFKLLTTLPNRWRVKVIHSVDEALCELKIIGLTA